MRRTGPWKLMCWVFGPIVCWFIGRHRLGRLMIPHCEFGQIPSRAYPWQGCTRCLRTTGERVYFE